MCSDYPEFSPPLCLHMLLLILLLHLPHSHQWVEPVHLVGFEVLQLEPKALWVLDVWPKPTTVQDRLDDGLWGMKNSTQF